MSSDTEITSLRRLQAALPYVVVLAAGVFLYHTADNFEFEQVSGRIGPGAWPKIILFLMLATAAWGAIAAFLKSGAPAEKAAEADEAEQYVRPPEIYPYRVWIAVGGTLCYLIALPLIGFFLATVVYSFGLMYLGHFRRPVPITLLSLAIALSFMFLFMRVVYVALPLGVAPFNELSYALMAAMGVR